MLFKGIAKTIGNHKQLVTDIRKTEIINEFKSEK